MPGNNQVIKTYLDLCGACVNTLTLPYTLVENLTDDAIALLYVTKFSTVSLCLTKLYLT